MYPFARQSGEKDYWGVAHEFHVAGQSGLRFVARTTSRFSIRSHLLTTTTIPRPASPSVSGDVDILVGNTFNGIDDHQAYVSLLQVFPGHHDRQNLRALVGLTLSSDSRRVNQAEENVLSFKKGVHRIPGGSRLCTDEDSLVTLAVG